ncbi:hypothetical protein ACTHGU_02445 [Chitinophagaceae bacterium MMS25-I14]
MSILDKLASSVGQRDEQPNIALAETIAVAGDKTAVQELVAGLQHKKKDIQSDCIKTLYEIGERKPGLIADYIDVFVPLLESKNNRLQWGAMTALNAIAGVNPDGVFAVLGRLALAVDKGSVITRDHYVAILIKLAAVPKYAGNAFALLLEQLQSCPTNQLPMYAENAMPLINAGNRTDFVLLLTSRLDEIEKESKRKRVEKVIRKVNK